MGSSHCFGEGGWVWEERSSILPAALGCSELTRPGEHNQHMPTYGWTKTWVFWCLSHSRLLFFFFLGDTLKLAFSHAISSCCCEHPVQSVAEHPQSFVAVRLSQLRNRIRKHPSQMFDLTESLGAVGRVFKLFCLHSSMWDSDGRLSHPAAPIGTKPLKLGPDDH